MTDKLKGVKKEHIWVFETHGEKQLEKIKKIADKWYDERYDTDWDFLQGSLMKIYKLVHKK